MEITILFKEDHIVLLGVKGLKSLAGREPVSHAPSCIGWLRKQRGKRGVGGMGAAIKIYSPWLSQLSYFAHSNGAVI